MNHVKFRMHGEFFALFTEFAGNPRVGDEISLWVPDNDNDVLFIVKHIRYVVSKDIDDHPHLLVDVLPATSPLLQFKIGENFRMSGHTWRCTDIGTRTVAAIKLNPNFSFSKSSHSTLTFTYQGVA